MAKFTKITDKQLKSKGVVALADKPNSTSSYGQGGLSAAALKAWFDNLGNLLAAKINEIIDVMNGGTDEDGNEYYGSDYISIPQLSDDIATLTALVNAIPNGTFASLLWLYQAAEDATSVDNLKSLQTIVYNLSKLIADDAEDLANYKTTIESKVETADKQLQTNIDALETSLQNNIDNEVAARASADNILQTNINAEASTRESADNVLQSNIDTLETALKAASAADLNVSINNSTYVITFTLTAIDGTVLATRTVDLPIESMVVDGAYNSETKEVVLTLQSGTTVSFSVADLVSGLVSTSDLSAEVTTLEGKISTLESSLTTKIEAADNELSTKISDSNTELTTKIEAVDEKVPSITVNPTGTTAKLTSITINGTSYLITGEKGDKGDTGSYIDTIIKTDTNGLVDTYTITLTNGDTHSFTVTNGEDGAVGADGTIVEANSSAEATEELSKLTVDGTTYAVSGEKYDLATETTDGLMSAADKTKLNTIRTVTFVSDGSTFSVQSVFDGSSVDAPTTDPTKSGYQFDGWSLTEGGTVAAFPITPTEDITYYAVFTQLVTVTFINNGSTYKTESVAINSSVSAPTSPTLSGCTFNGWSKTDGGSAVTFPLTVTADTTLYALWNITVTFICDGSTYSTSTVSRGSSVSAPSTDPTVSGYTFKGWSATSGGTTAVSFPVTLTTNTTYYAILEANYSSTLNNNTWAQISAASQGGIASSLWSVGDTHSVTLSGTVGTLSVSGTYYAYILGFDHNSTYEGTNTIHFGTFKTAQTDGVDVALCDSNYGSSSYGSTKYFNMNHWGSTSSSPYNTNYGGWSACDLRYDILGSTDVAPSVYGSVKTTGCTGYDASSTCATNPVSGTLMAAIEEDLRAVMKPVTKYSDNVGNATTTASAISATVDYLPLLDEFEVQGARSYANSYAQNYQAQYDYFANGNSKIRYKHSATGTAVSWWLRSPRYGYVHGFCIVDTDGSANYYISNTSRGLAPLFVV